MEKAIINQMIELGIPLDQAEIVADVLLTADMYGVNTHGLSTLPAHLKRVKLGSYNLNPEFKIINKTESFAVIDGNNSLGFISANYCMRYAANQAKNKGIFHVFSRNNNTCGPAFYYPLKIAEDGLIGIILTNSPAQMAPTGGKEKILGTNPFAAVIPVPESNPIIIDMATSIVAKSKFKQYSEQGKKLPDGWALDDQGMPTNDPNEAIKGLINPMGGYKGYAIAMLIDILTGVLSGASYLNNVGRFYTEENNGMNVGFCCIAINPQIILGNEYKEKINNFVQIIRNSKTISDAEIRIPGDGHIKSMISNKKNV